MIASLLLAASLPVVVLPDSPTEIEKSAAAELAGELGKCLGEALGIIAEGEAAPSGAPRLYVGATRAAKAARGGAPWRADEVFVESLPDGVAMDGDPARGPIYAVDLYLEKWCGVRWWTSTESFHPALDSVPVEGERISYAPQFKYRETYYLDGFDPLFKVRSKGNFTSKTRAAMCVDPGSIRHVPPSLGGDCRLYFFDRRKSSYHSFFQILPPGKHFEKHPEWYSLRDGKRVAEQLCLANAEMRAAYIQETLRRLRESPDVDFISVSQQDSKTGMCECEACAKMAEEDGGAPSGPYLAFANEVADAISKEFPRVKVDTFAYKFTRKPPAKTRPGTNVIVRLCAMGCDLSRPFDDPASTNNAAFVEDLRGWSKVAAGRLMVWQYLADFSNYMLPLPNVTRAGRDVRLLAENGASGVFEQGDALCRAGSFAPLLHYVYSHLLWDPSLDSGALIDEFLAGYYGKSAAAPLRKYIETVEKASSRTKSGVPCHYTTVWFMPPGAKLSASDAIDEAVAAAEKDGEPYASRVKRERLSVDHMMFANYDAMREYATKHGRRWTRPATRAEAVENWIRAVKALGVKARLETTSPGELESYFGKLRK